MKIAVIGTGYVGLVTGTCLSELGHEVTCVDINKEKVKKLKRGIPPIYEPGLSETIKRNLSESRLKFTTKHSPAVKYAEAIFVAVDTPAAEDGSVNMDYVHQSAEDIGKGLQKLPQSFRFYRVIINKSTVPIGTGDEVKEIIKKFYKGPFDVVSNPEFLREGQAVSDFFHPDRIVIGNPTERAKKLMERLYRPFMCPILYTDLKTAEMIKYASNAYLATSISFINSIANICEGVGADVSQVAQGMKLDKRIGVHAFLSAGIGYGGSCFPKDVKGLIDIARTAGRDFKMLEAAEDVNQYQRERFFEKIRQVFPRLKNKRIAVWGLAFKPKTDDMRQAPSVDIAKRLFGEGAKLKAFDPVAEAKAKKLLPSLRFCPNPYEPTIGADLLLILTEWDEFKTLDRVRLKKGMRKPNIVDGRNVFEPAEMKKLGFRYLSIGRP